MNFRLCLATLFVLTLLSPAWGQDDATSTAKSSTTPAPVTSDLAANKKVSALNILSTEISDKAMIDVLNFKDIDILDVFKVLSDKSGLNIITGNGISGRVTIFLSNVKLKDVLRIILDANSLAYAVEDGVVRVMTAADYERRYGHVFGGEVRTRTFHLNHTEVVDMVSLLNQIKSPTGKIMAEPKFNTLVLMDSPSQMKVMEDLINKIDKPMSTRVFQLSYAKAKDVVEKIESSIISKGGNVRFDERSNKLIVTDVSERIDRIAKLVAAFDIKQEEVFIEAKIVQIVLSDENKFGIDWELLFKKYNNLNVRNRVNPLSDNDRGGKLNVGVLSDDNYTVLLQALNTFGYSDILSSPRIMALNGQEAKILVGSTEPYVTSTTTIPSSGPSTTSEAVNFIDVGVKLFVTPQIHSDGFITMKLKPEVSSVTRTLTTGNKNEIPVVDTSEAETTVTVKNGVTIVIGGLIKDEKIANNAKIPILGDIPIIKHAFRSNEKKLRKTEIVVFLTPRISTGDISVPSKK